MLAGSLTGATNPCKYLSKKTSDGFNKLHVRDDLILVITESRERDLGEGRKGERERRKKDKRETRGGGTSDGAGPGGWGGGADLRREAERTKSEKNCCRLT